MSFTSIYDTKNIDFPLGGSFSPHHNFGQRARSITRKTGKSRVCFLEYIQKWNSVPELYILSWRFCAFSVWRLYNLLSGLIFGYRFIISIFFINKSKNAENL